MVCKVDSRGHSQVHVDIKANPIICIIYDTGQDSQSCCACARDIMFFMWRVTQNHTTDKY